MSVIIGSARHDEYGNITGGAAGDQTGEEVSTQGFYLHSKGWYGFTPKSNDVAEKIAEAMKQACENNNIGYDQSGRDTLLTQYKKYGSIKAIATKCECDCSSLVRVCIYQATGTLLSDFDTGGEPSVLASSGLFKDKVKVTSASQCTLGMVMVTQSKGHTVIVISGAPLGGSSSSSGSTGSGTTSGTKTVADAKSKDDSLAGDYTVNASDGLNMRYDAGTNNDVVKVLSNGASVHNYGYYTSVSGTKWLLVVATDGSKGYCSSKHLKKTSSSSSSSTGSTGSGTTSSTSSGELTVDGEIGPKTVSRLQQFCGLTQDGFIDGQPSSGKQYWTAITSTACKWTGGKSDTVRALQKYLYDKGYAVGTNFKDGKLGKNTAKALQNFLTVKGYYTGKVDGYIGEKSAMALQNWLNSY